MGEAQAARGGGFWEAVELEEQEKKALPEVACSDGILVLTLRAAPSPEQQQRQPPRRWEAITCLIPVGKLAPTNFS